MPIELHINDRQIKSPLLKALGVIAASLLLFAILSIAGLSVVLSVGIVITAAVILWVTLPFLMIAQLFKR